MSRTDVPRVRRRRPSSGGTGASAVSRALRALVLVVALAASALAVPGAAAAATEPRMQIDPRLQETTVCLPVTDPLGRPRMLYGKRYTVPSARSSTPAIVLVHGTASSTANWDFSPTWSTARALATSGYVVYSYDRLGFAASPYFDTPGGGELLTTEEHRRQLHQVVGDVKSGGYAVSTSGSCVGAQPGGGMRSPTVIPMGHSAGAWVVAGYPGTYHDVAAMIQTSIFATTAGLLADSDQQSEGGGFTPNATHPDYYDFFQQRAECEAFNLFRPAALPSVTDIACTPPFIPTPFGEISDLAAKLAINDAAIANIGPGTPVLLASGDHDTTAPPEKAAADFAYYQANCRCDVSRYTIPDSGHLYQVHRSLPTFVDEITRWLTSRGLPPAQR